MYDRHFADQQLMNKKALFKHFGLALDRKLLFFCIMAPTQFPWNPDLIEILGRLTENDAFALPCQVLIRLHPIYFRINNGSYLFQKDIDKLLAIQDKHSHIHYDYPQVSSQKMSYDMPVSEALKLGSTLKHSDVLLCFFSSMMIEAGIFNTPVVNIALYSKNKIPTHVIMAHNHIRRVLSTKGVKTALSEQELVSCVNAYLKAPFSDHKGREKIVDQEAGPNHGKAGAVIGNHILDILG